MLGDILYGPVSLIICLVLLGFGLQEVGLL